MSRRPSTPPAAAEAEESLSPLSSNSFTLAPGDRQTSNTRFGAIGGPSPTTASFAAPAPAPEAATPSEAVTTTATATATTGPEPGFVLPAPHAQTSQNFRHVTTIENLMPAASNTQRTLRSNQPGRSYVTNLPTWRRGPEQPAERPAQEPAQRPVQRPVQRAAPSVSCAAAEPAARVENPEPSRPVVQRDNAPVESRAGVGRGGFDGNATAFRGLNARAPVFQARGMQPREQQQQQRRGGGFQGLSLHRPQHPFKPMNMKLDPDAAKRPLTEEEKRYRDEHGISHNYKGDSRNPSNESANIPDDENCSVWITLLPPDCTYKDLLGAVAVHRPGQVFFSVISPPKEPTDAREARLASSRTCAAKIVFYKAAAARHLIHVSGRGEFVVRGFRARVIANKIKVAPQPDNGIFTSRVVWITGPPRVVNEEYLTELFEGYFRWDTEEILVRVEPDEGEEDSKKKASGERTIEWRFAAYHCQAGSALPTINSYCTEATPCYAPDPCAQVLTGEFARLTV